MVSHSRLLLVRLLTIIAVQGVLKMLKRCFVRLSPVPSRLAGQHTSKTSPAMMRLLFNKKTMLKKQLLCWLQSLLHRAGC